MKPLLEDLKNWPIVISTTITLIAVLLVISQTGNTEQITFPLNTANPVLNNIVGTLVIGFLTFTLNYLFYRTLSIFVLKSKDRGTGLHIVFALAISIGSIPVITISGFMYATLFLGETEGFSTIPFIVIAPLYALFIFITYFAFLRKSKLVHATPNNGLQKTGAPSDAL